MLAAVVLSCLVSACASALLCALAGEKLLAKLSLPLSLAATGFLLALSLGHILPEAFEGADPPHQVALALLGGVIFMCALEMLLTSGHSHTCERSANADALAEGGAGLLAGSFIHTFCDGAIIAAAYISNFEVGLAATLAVLTHEIAHELGDYAVMLSLGMSRRAAYCVNVTAGAGCLTGGLAAYGVIRSFDFLLQYALALCAASFIYVALSDLLPRLRHGATRNQALSRLLLIILGAALCLLLAGHE
ncbi:MAG: ZIP family metal transporter [Succinivibrio sp.]|nr:ZIP family metal transporter [Succinivibrio sp.]